MAHEDPPQAREEEAREEEASEITCPYCLTVYGLAQPPPLTELCEHGSAFPVAHAYRVRMNTLADGRVKVQLDAVEGPPVICVLPRVGAERLRHAIGKPGAAMMVERWRA